MAKLSTLWDKLLYEVSLEEVKRLEEILPRAAGKFFYRNDKPSLLNKIADNIFVPTSLREQREACKELVKYLKAVDVVAYRPAVISRLEKQANDHIRFRVFNYFDPDDYHDRFLKLCGEELLRGDVETLSELVKLGYEHIVWTNVCDRALDNLKFFQPKSFELLQVNLEKPDYPLEFFKVLNYLEQQLADYGRKTFLPLKDPKKEMRLPVDEKVCLGEMIRIGGLHKVGFASINVRRLRENCINLLNNIKEDFLASLIEMNYLDREIDVYLENLEYLRQNLIGMSAHETLKDLSKELKDLIRITKVPVRAGYIFGRLTGLEKKIKSAKRMKLPRKEKLPRDLQEYWFTLFRRSKKYLAASLVTEAICHVAHEFPHYTQEYEFEHSPFKYSISELPTNKTIKSLAKVFSLSPSNLKEQHLKTTKICRRVYMEDFAKYQEPKIDI